MSHLFLFPKLRLFIMASLLVLPLNLLAASDSSADQEDGDDDPDGLCGEVILESLGSIKDVMIEKYGKLCREDAKNGKIKKDEKGKPLDTENCKKLKCFEDKSLKFKFKSSGEGNSSSSDGEAEASASAEGSKKGLFGFNEGFEKAIKAQDEKSQAEGKMTLSRCVDEEVDTSVPYSQMSSAQKQCNFLMNSTAGFVDKMRDSDVVTGYLGKSDKKQEQEEKEKLQYAYNHLADCQSNIKSCKGLSGQEARRLYDKYSGHSNPELRRWAESMRALIPITLSYDSSSSSREPSSSGGQRQSEPYDSAYCEGVRKGRALLPSETMSAALCFSR